MNTLVSRNAQFAFQKEVFNSEQFARPLIDKSYVFEATCMLSKEKRKRKLLINK